VSPDLAPPIRLGFWPNGSHAGVCTLFAAFHSDMASWSASCAPVDASFLFHPSAVPAIIEQSATEVVGAVTDAAIISASMPRRMRLKAVADK
jgi:hypothetical protein